MQTCLHIELFQTFVRSRVEPFAVYAYSRRICPLKFFIVFKLENNKKILTKKSDGYTRMLQMIPPLMSDPGNSNANSYLQVVTRVTLLKKRY